GDVLFVEPESGMVRKVSASAGHALSTAAGFQGRVGWNDGALGEALVSETIAVAVRQNGEAVLLDGATARVRALRNGVVDTIAGSRGTVGADGSGRDAGFGFPRAVAVAPDG